MTSGPVLLRRWRPAPVPVGLPGLHAVQVTAASLEAGGIHHRTLAVTGYPREVGPGWLEPLLDHPGPIDVALHIDPLPTAVAAERLRRQLARLESSRRLDAARGRLATPRSTRPRGRRRTWPGGSPAARGGCSGSGCTSPSAATAPTSWRPRRRRVQAAAASLLLDAHPTTFRRLAGVDHHPAGGPGPARAAPHHGHPRGRGRLPLRLRRPARLPPDAAGVLLRDQPGHPRAGLVGPVGPGQPQPGHPGPLRRRQVLPRQAGTLRNLYQGVQVLVVDPEDEYQRLADAVGGTILRLGAPGVQINPLDLGHRHPTP